MTYIKNWKNKTYEQVMNDVPNSYDFKHYVILYSGGIYYYWDRLTIK